MKEVIHNLPPQPYKKFFGREDSVKKITEILLEGNTFIASIDGVGGIGKTALAYYFCEEVIIPSKRFDYVIWITAKESVFDPFSQDKKIKPIKNEFKGIETLIDTTLTVSGFEELLDSSFKYKKAFFENEIVKTEPVFFVLDNLENVDDISFFEYITKSFNKFAVNNKNLKVLTTSRKRKRLVDFPIEIEGLSAEDALAMLKYLAREYNVKDILNASDYQNIKLIEKVGRIPLGIEFIVGQMHLGKSRGEIYAELEGYPSLEGITDENEKKKRLSDIIMFSFKNMYETIENKHQHVFKVIAALQKNKSKHDPDISLELLMNITGYSKYELENALETLIDNKLIILLENNTYSISQMAINFVKQFYEDFEKIEDEVVGKKNQILKEYVKLKDKVDMFINNIYPLLEENRYEEAEQQLIKALDAIQDYRIYYELAKVQRILNKFGRASENFKAATELNPKNVKVWYEWINMEDNRGRHNIAFQIIENALEKTNNDVSIVLQKINILKFKKDFQGLRSEVKRFLNLYKKEERRDEYLRLLRNWKNIEYNLFKEGKSCEYFNVVELLINEEIDKEIKLQLLREELRVAKKLALKDDKMKRKVKRINKRIKQLENTILQSIGLRIKNLNRLFNAKKYEETKKEARKILNWIEDEEENIEYSKNALRVLLQILASERDYDRIITTFEDFKNIGYKDENCIAIYEKAKKEKENFEKEKIIQKITINFQESEIFLRDIIMDSLEYDEEILVKLVKEKGKAEWIEQWVLTKDKSLKKDILLIHYTDLSHLRSLLSWCKSLILNKIESSQKHKAKEIIKKVVAYLENYITKERNEAFHSRMKLYEVEELNEILVDSNRFFNLLKELKSLMN